MQLCPALLSQLLAPAPYHFLRLPLLQQQTGIFAAEAVVALLHEETVLSLETVAYAELAGRHVRQGINEDSRGGPVSGFYVALVLYGSSVEHLMMHLDIIGLGIIQI